ncbi:MAG: YbaK/EbsC family protein [Ignavibacteriae bacterium]|nr:MAG: YbaK/EbsC family protein [Ignavibacteriota bacterium]
MTTTQEFLKYLVDNDVEHSVLTHGPALSAHEIAQATHIPERFVVQTKLMKIDGYCWMIVLSADRNINHQAVSRALHAKNIKEGLENDWSFFFPNCHTSTIPPFGNLYGFRVLADASLQEGKRIVFSACSSTQSVFMRWEDYAHLVQPLIGEISQVLPMSETQRKQQDIAPFPRSSDHAFFSQRQFELDGFFQNLWKKS